MQRAICDVNRPAVGESSSSSSLSGQQQQQQPADLMMPVRRPISASVTVSVDQSRASNDIDANRCSQERTHLFHWLAAAQMPRI